MMWKMKLLLTIVLLLSSCAPVSVAYSGVTRQADDVEGLWLDISLGPPLVEWFNDIAQPDDIARVDHVSLVDLLDQVTVGRRLVVFKSVADAELLVPRLADKMDIVGYNLEHGPSNQPNEQADPVGSIRRMRALADQYGLAVALGPDRGFALTDGVEMAPYADIFVLQVQRAQTEPETVREFVLPLVEELRQANPALEISVQVRTEGDAMAIAGLIASMQKSLEGVSILTSAETADIAQALVEELRPTHSDEPTPGAPLPQPTLPATNDPQTGVLVATPTTSVRRALATPTLASAPLQTPAGQPWPLIAGILAFGIFLGGLMATALLYLYQMLRARQG